MSDLEISVLLALILAASMRTAYYCGHYHGIRQFLSEEPMIGGTVTEICNVPGRPEVLFVEVAERPYSKVEKCGVLCENNEHSQKIQIGDSFWWQSGLCHWTPQDQSVSDFPIRKIGYSGVTFESVQKSGNPE